MPLVAVLIAAQLLDLVTFLPMVIAHGLDAELNPIVQRLSVSLGLPGILLGKGALIVYLVALIAITAARRPRLAAGVAVLGTAAGLLGGISNLATL